MNRALILLTLAGLMLGSVATGQIRENRWQPLGGGTGVAFMKPTGRDIILVSCISESRVHNPPHLVAFMAARPRGGSVPVEVDGKEWSLRVHSVGAEPGSGYAVAMFAPLDFISAMKRGSLLSVGRGRVSRLYNLSGATVALNHALGDCGLPTR